MDPRREQLIARIAIGAVVAAAVVVGAVVVVFTDTTGEGGSGLGQAFEYDIKEFRRFDESLRKYEETGRIETGLEEVRAVATGPADRVFVAGDETVAIFGAVGPTIGLRAVGASAGGASPGRSGPRSEPARVIRLDEPPRGIAVDEDGSVYVIVRNRVEVYGKSGARRASWQGPAEDSFLLSVAVSEEFVFVGDIKAKIVLRYDKSGELLGRIGEKDDARGIPGIAIYQPCLGLAVGPEQLLRVTNPGRHRVELYTFGGELVAWWGEYSARIEGFCGCCNPVNIALFPDRRTVTAEKHLPRVKVYDEEGKLEAVVAGPEDFQGNPKRIDVAVDSKGRILVLDPTLKAVRIFSRKPGEMGRSAQGVNGE